MATSSTSAQHIQRSAPVPPSGTGWPAINPGASPVETRVELLRAMGHRYPGPAADLAHGWIVDTGRRVLHDRDTAAAELSGMFLAGKPAADLDGIARGTLVSVLRRPLIDRVLATGTTFWAPWTGKRFDLRGGLGGDLFARRARWPSKLIWPFYRTRKLDDARGLFDFATRVEPGALDPSVRVLVLDYAADNLPKKNPWPFIRRIRAELVELVPGAYLGKMLRRKRNGEHTMLAYFALRSTEG